MPEQVKHLLEVQACKGMLCQHVSHDLRSDICSAISLRTAFNQGLDDYTFVEVS